MMLMPTGPLQYQRQFQDTLTLPRHRFLSLSKEARRLLPKIVCGGLCIRDTVVASP